MCDSSKKQGKARALNVEEAAKKTLFFKEVTAVSAEKAHESVQDT